MDRLIAEADKRGIKIMMDLVVKRLARGVSVRDAIVFLNDFSRDHARIPIQWNDQGKPLLTITNFNDKLVERSDQGKVTNQLIKSGVGVVDDLIKLQLQPYQALVVEIV